MTARHLAAGVVLVAGLVAGTLADPLPRRAAMRSGEYLILTGDFHVNTFPGDGALTPRSLQDEAIRAGIDVITVVNHNAFAAPRLIPWLPEDPDAPIVIPGEEITNPDYHLIAVGIDRRIAPDGAVPEIVAQIHARGGVAIAAHPARTFAGWDDRALATVDGTEVARADSRKQDRRDYVEVFERTRRTKPALAPIGASDMHTTLGLGDSRTFLFVRERSVAGVLEAIRSGRTVAINDRGELFGNPDLVAIIRRQAPAGRTDPHPWMRRLAAALAWLGVAGLALA
jgi:hypothetical protein